ncbi:MAG TPA: DUF362 domain-containing protein [Candidatus Wallbacteria bacterium]|nr:DUF362 domain-containing protein [Candidatus Wallbacteria bacterium]
MQKVALIKTKTYDRNEIYNNIVRIFGFFGGAEKFFGRGEKVLLKPNLLFARKSGEHVTTHPEIVHALCRILKDIGCKIIIGDSPGFSSAITVAKKCGIYDSVKNFGAEFVNFEKSVEIKINSEDRIFKKFEVAREIIEADKIVNLAKLKSHGQMLLTMSVKNTFGVVAGLLKPQWHFKAGVDAGFFARMLIELNLAVAPVFSILDGVYGMQGNGPANGEARELNILAGSVSSVALDTVAADLIKVPPDAFYTGQVARKMKLDGAFISDIEIVGSKKEDFNISGFKLPQMIDLQWPVLKSIRRFLRGFSLPEPLYDFKKCRFCKICFEVCPAKAIDFKTGEYIKFDFKKCIRCFCCQELCPFGAITVKESVFDKFRKMFHRNKQSAI